MALKRLKTKTSKRLPARQKYKILKKIREHKRKVRREDKHKKKSKKGKLIQIPNICPFKEEFMKEVETEKARLKDITKKLFDMQKQEQLSTQTLESLKADAEGRGDTYEIIQEKLSKDSPVVKPSKDNSLKAYYKEFKKVIDNSDVILEVVDSRDPLGTRCSAAERLVRSAPGNKRIVLILNKADLVPKDNLKQWITYFRKRGPVTPFKASTQDQTSKLGRGKINKNAPDEEMQGSICLGADLLMSMLANYCRNKSIKTSIRVGVVGIPNVGKSSVINSLIRRKACNVGCTPGITKVMQEVELDSKIRLFDCPGIIFPTAINDANIPILQNAQRVSDVKDPCAAAENILKRASKEYFCRLYDVTEYDSYDEFFVKAAQRMGKFVKGGIPNAEAAARVLLNDWNTGKIKYCTSPPEEESCHISATIVNKDNQDFESETYTIKETEFISDLDVNSQSALQIKSVGPVISADVATPMDLIESVIQKDEEFNRERARKRKAEKDVDEPKPKVDPVMKIDGNQTLNKNLKELQKKKKKLQTRHEKKMNTVLNPFDNLSLGGTDEKYDFDDDYIIKE